MSSIFGKANDKKPKKPQSSDIQSKKVEQLPAYYLMLDWRRRDFPSVLRFLKSNSGETYPMNSLLEKLEKTISRPRYREFIIDTSWTLQPLLFSIAGSNHAQMMEIICDITENLIFPEVENLLEKVPLSMRLDGALTRGALLTKENGNQTRHPNFWLEVGKCRSLCLSACSTEAQRPEWNQPLVLCDESTSQYFQTDEYQKNDEGQAYRIKLECEPNGKTRLLARV